MHSISQDVNSNTTYDVSSFVLHPNYNDLTFANDVALIMLKRPVIPSDRANFICVEKTVLIDRNDSFVVVGWGYTLVNSTKKLSDILMQVSVPNLNTQQCLYTYDPMKQVCAGDPTKTLDSCKL